MMIKLKIEIQSEIKNEMYWFYWLATWTVDRPYTAAKDIPSRRNVEKKVTNFLNTKS